MKLYVWKAFDGIKWTDSFIPPPINSTYGGNPPVYLGTSEVTEPPKEPIKMTIPIVPPDDARGTFSVHLELPVDARNIKCTYEIDQ